MNQLIRNVRFLMGDLKQVPFAELVGVHQTTVGRLLTASVSPSLETVQAIATHFGLSLDDLVHRDLATEGRSAPSQPAQLDLVRMGLALTSFDKALKDMEIQGQLGTLAEPLQFAYGKAFRVKDPDSAEDRELFDDLVESKLRGWIDGRRRAIEEGKGQNRKVAAKGQKVGHSGK